MDQFSQEADERPEERPERVDAIVRLHDARVRFREAFHFATFLRERLHDADAGDRVGEDVRHAGPDAAPAEKAPREPFADARDEPSNERE